MQAWAAILSRAKQNFGPELLFVDGFAGPGEYSTGELGSPLVALDAIIGHTQEFVRPVRFRFIESDPDRHAHLVSKLAEQAQRIEACSHVKVDAPILGDCESELRKLIAERKAEGASLGPALFFFDQFGYSQVSMDLVGTILKNDQCEVFSYFNCQRLVPYLTDETKAASITQAYGNESWREAINLVGHSRQDCLIDRYTDSLRASAKDVHPWSFAMFSAQNQLLHWLVFSTRNLSGLEHMKKAMWRADKDGGCRFSDRNDPNQQTFFTSMDTDEWHAGELARLLKGRTMTEAEMHKFVLTETPFHKFKKAVQKLRSQGRVTSVTAGAKYPIRFS